MTASHDALYDRIGARYRVGRAEDPRLAAAITRALGPARTVVNVGAGTGSYEPLDRAVIAVEPSSVMIAQRPPGSAPVVRAVAEHLPFPDRSFDASMAVLSDHHWTDRLAGLHEMRRVARSRVVVFQWDMRYVEAFWLTRDYLPSFRKRLGGMTADDIAVAIGGGSVEPFPIPSDMEDGFLSAYWRRPEAYLDPEVRANISVFALMAQRDVDAFVRQLRCDLEGRSWHRRNAAILDLPEMDLGYRLIIGE